MPLYTVSNIKAGQPIVWCSTCDRFSPYYWFNSPNFLSSRSQTDNEFLFKLFISLWASDRFYRFPWRHFVSKIPFYFSLERWWLHGVVVLFDIICASVACETVQLPTCPLLMSYSNDMSCSDDIMSNVHT